LKIKFSSQDWNLEFKRIGIYSLFGIWNFFFGVSLFQFGIWNFKKLEFN